MLAKHALSQLSYGPVRRGHGDQPEAGCANSHFDGVVGLGRLELPTSRLSSARSNQLSYKPEPFRRTARLIGPRSRAGKSHWQVAQASRSRLCGLVREERETKAAKSRKWSSRQWVHCPRPGVPRDRSEER